MTFEHCNFLGDLELEKKETPGCRLYHLPDGQWVPSITSVTSFYNRQIFIDWRKRVGIEEANRMVIFDSNLEHQGVTCTDEKRRVIVNFNYDL